MSVEMRFNPEMRLIQRLVNYRTLFYTQNVYSASFFFGVYRRLDFYSKLCFYDDKIKTTPNSDLFRHY